MIRSGRLVFRLLPLFAAAQDDAKDVVAWARQTYDVEIVVKGTNFPIKRSGYTIGGEDAPDTSVAAYLPLIRKEMAKYPKPLIERVGIKKIILARKLSVNGQERAAIPGGADEKFCAAMDDEFWKKSRN